MTHDEMTQRVRDHFTRCFATLDPKEAETLIVHLLDWLTDSCGGDPATYGEAVPAVFRRCRDAASAIDFARRLYANRPKATRH